MGGQVPQIWLDTQVPAFRIATAVASFAVHLPVLPGKPANHMNTCIYHYVFSAEHTIDGSPGQKPACALLQYETQNPSASGFQF